VSVQLPTLCFVYVLFVMATIKVLVKVNSKILCSKRNLLLLCNEHSVKIIKITPSGDDFNVFCLNAIQTEKLFSDEMLQTLTNSGFSPILPAELKANRSVLVRNVDPHIFENTVVDIKDELGRCNDWCIVNEVFKFSKTMKIVFKSSSMAEKCLSSGLSMFYLHVPGHNILRDKFVKLNTCFACYAVEDHSISHCPKLAEDPSFSVCSKCAVQGHNFKSCTKSPSEFRCINCKGSHHSMAMACPMRREALRKKRSSQDTRKKFSEVARLPDPSTREPNHEIVCKSVSLIFMASLKNMDNPGSFSNELNKLYRMNGLPPLNLVGFIPPTLTSFRTSAAVEVETGTFDATVGNVPGGPLSLGIPLAGPSGHVRDRLRSAGNLEVGAAASDSSLATSSSSPSSAVQSDAWSDYRVFKSWGTRLSSVQDILATWEAGEVIIVSESGDVPDHNEVVSMMSSGVMPRVTALKKEVFRNLSNAPGGFSDIDNL